MNRKLTMDSKDFDGAIELIRNSRNLLVTTHTKPDGDACGCLAVICEVLTGLGKDVRAVIGTPVPPWYDFLFERKPSVLGRDITPEDLRQGQFDLVVIVDTNSMIQLGRFGEYLKDSSAAVLVIDHHATSDGLGTVDLTDASASAAALIVFDLCRHAGWSLTAKMAEGLFVALATDTGWFQFSNADARTYRTCAELIDAGANPKELYAALYNTFSKKRFDLMLAMLASLELHLDGRFATMEIARGDFERTGADLADTESLINECHRIATVRASALFVELNDGRIRCSLRSRCALDVSEVAQKFGGGGHKMAAGTYVPAPIERAKELVLAEMRDRFGRLGSA